VNTIMDFVCINGGEFLDMLNGHQLFKDYAAACVLFMLLNERGGPKLEVQTVISVLTALGNVIILLPNRRTSL
jgi:hypothetical protein